MSAVSRSLSFLGWMGIFSLLGCGGADAPDREPTVKVTGSVKYKDQPVAGAAVTFHPETEPGKLAEKKGAFATTDESGNFTLKVYADAEGAVPGKYKITVTKKEIVANPGEVDQDDPNYVPPEEQKAPPAPSKDLLPVKYSKQQTTDLNAEIVDGENPPIDLILKD